MYRVVASDGQVYGPVDVPTIEQWCREGRVLATTNLIDPLTSRVLQAQELPELASIFSVPPVSPPVVQGPPQSAATSVTGPRGQTPIQIINQVGPQYPATPAGPYAPKQRVVAGLLALFFGPLGIHRFYLGHNGLGVAMLLITILTCGWGMIITGIWSLIDAILCFTGGLTDSQNRPLV